MRKIILAITSLLLVCGVYSQNVVNEDFSELIKRGNKVFLDIDKESKTGEYIIQEFQKWGYWTVVEDVRDAQFKIQFHIATLETGDRRLAEGYGEIMTLDNKVIKTSKKYKGYAAALNGFNSFKEVSKGIINKFFKKEFK